MQEEQYTPPKKFTKVNVLQAINDEPEMPGPLPEELQTTLCELMMRQDMDELTELLRLIVQLTKQGINNRVSKLEE